MAYKCRDWLLVLIVFAGSFLGGNFFTFLTHSGIAHGVDIPEAPFQIKTGKIVIDDDSGIPRIVLQVGSKGPSLNIFDQSGNERMVMRVGDGPVSYSTMEMKDERGKPRLKLLTGDMGGHETSRIMLMDNNDLERLSVRVKTSSDTTGVNAGGVEIVIQDRNKKKQLKKFYKDNG